MASYPLTNVLRNILQRQCHAAGRLLPVTLWIVFLGAIPIARTAAVDYTPEELMSRSNDAHARLGRFSMQTWTRTFYWDDVILPYAETSVSKIVHERPGVTALVGVSRRAYSSRDPEKKITSHDYVTRVGYRIERKGPRFLVGEWSSDKNKLIDRPVTAETYRKNIMPRLSRAMADIHPFAWDMFRTYRPSKTVFPGLNDTSRIAGRENIAGHECIRLDRPTSTIWFDADNLIVRRVLTQTKGRNFSEIVDLFCDIRPLRDGEEANLYPSLEDNFENTAMQWVPFIPLEQLKENIRITGRAAGLLIARPEDQPQAQSALPPLTPEQRAAIVTIEGDVLSGLGFYVRYDKGDYLATDVRFLTQNRWVKIRDWQGNKITFIDAVHAPNSRVVLLKATSVPGRLSTPAASPQKKGAFLFLLCAFHKDQGRMLPAFCVSRTTPAGSYSVDHALSDYISGGPILDTDDGTVSGILMKSDPPKIKPRGPVMPAWHAEPLFTHKQWVQIGMVPMK